MANLGEGISSPAIEQDPSVAQIQATQQGVSQALQVSLPATGFVASLEGLSGLLTLAGGIGISITSDGVSTITITVSGISQAALAQSHVDVVSPNAGNDSNQGYAQFSCWINTLIPAIFMCVDSAVGAAVWLQISN